MLPPFPVLFTTPELRGLGAVGLLGSATAATYDPTTGVGSATRVDAVNQSYVTFPVVNGRTYRVDITCAQTVGIRNSIGGSILVVAPVGQSSQFVVGASGALVFTFNGASGTANFTINSIRAR